MAFTAGYAYPVGKVLTHQYQFNTSQKPAARPDHNGWQPGDRLRIDRRGRAYGAGYPITRGRRSWKFCDANSRNTAEFLSRPKTSSARFRSRLVSPTPDISPSPGSAGPGFRSRAKQSAGHRWPTPASSFATSSAAVPAPVPTNVEQSDLHQAIFGSHGR